MMRECPFCASTNLTASTANRSNGNVRVTIVCGGCGAQGPAGVDTVEARQRWNDRRMTIVNIPPIKRPQC